MWVMCTILKDISLNWKLGTDLGCFICFAEILTWPFTRFSKSIEQQKWPVLPIISETISFSIIPRKWVLSKKFFPWSSAVFTQSNHRHKWQKYVTVLLKKICFGPSTINLCSNWSSAWAVQKLSGSKMSLFLVSGAGKVNQSLLLVSRPTLWWCKWMAQSVLNSNFCSSFCIFMLFCMHADDLNVGCVFRCQILLEFFLGKQSSFRYAFLCLAFLLSLHMHATYMIPRVHKNKSRQLHTMGSVTAEFEVRHRWRTTTLFSGRYALNAEHVHARSLQKLHLFDWHFRLGLHFACTCSSKYSVQRWVQRSRINVFPFLVQTDVGSDDELRILPWQHS